MSGALPLLRAPPFPGVDAAVTRPGVAAGGELAPDVVDHLLDAIRAARVGGCFWGASAGPAGVIVVRGDASSDDAECVRALLTPAEHAAAVWVHPRAQVDPWSLLDGATTLAVHGDDEWAALGAIVGVRVHLLSPGRFGAPGDGAARLRENVAADLLHTAYRDPFTGRDTDIAATIALLGDWRRMVEANRGIVAACGFSWWKRREIARFLWTPAHRLRFFRSERRALAHAARHGGTVAIWPSRVSAGMVASAQTKDVSLVRVEDGFIRSAGLGSNLVPPSSVAVDRRGIHYDPSRPSDLEHLLAEGDFPADLLARAERLRATVLAAGIGKYGSDAGIPAPPRRGTKRIVLVPGQVEDDMSVRLGATGGVTRNIDLLRRARELEPDAEIWFRPHPDVDAGHRIGAVRDADALRHADRIVRGGGMAPLLDRVDAVHVLTSLTGFEALLRGREVACHGVPFYAGWGLTRDYAAVPDRRGRRLTLTQLIAAVLIVYPRYLDPVSGLPCPPEVLIARIRDGDARNRLGWVTRVRQVQGRMLGLLGR